MTTDERQMLVLDYVPLANSMASEKSRLTPPCVTFEELKSAAYMGLVEAASRTPARENFQPHARIRGGMLDYLRSLGWGPRGSHWTAVSYDAAGL